MICLSASSSRSTTQLASDASGTPARTLLERPSDRGADGASRATLRTGGSGGFATELAADIGVSGAAMAKRGERLERVGSSGRGAAPREGYAFALGAATDFGAAVAAIRSGGGA